jgi:ferritin
MTRNKKNQIIKVNFCLNISSLDKARKLSIKQDRSVSSLIRTLIEEAYTNKDKRFAKSES